MITCGGQATIPIVAAVSAVVPVAYAEIVASIASRSAGPGTRANIDEFTQTTAAALEQVGGAAQRQGDHHAEPGRAADDHAEHGVLRDPGRGAEPGPLQDQVTASIDAMVAEVRGYVPGYTLRAEPQYDPPR